MNWKTINYLAHRWLGITLGALTFTWFASGIAMMYYPWPAPTPSEEIARNRPFGAQQTLIGFDSAIVLANDGGIIGGRLSMWNGRAVYALWSRQGSRMQPARLVDAATGRRLSPISASDAVDVARTIAGERAALRSVRLLMAGCAMVCTASTFRHSTSGAWSGSWSCYR